MMDDGWTILVIIVSIIALVAVIAFPIMIISQYDNSAVCQGYGYAKKVNYGGEFWCVRMTEGGVLEGVRLESLGED